MEKKINIHKILADVLVLIMIAVSLAIINTDTTYAVVQRTMSDQEMLDLFYPVGSYYETSDTSFNPNTVWGGTWREDEAGLVLVSTGIDDGSVYIINSKGGERTHVLTTSETATKAHSHTYSKSNTSTNNTTLTLNQIPSHAGHLPVNNGSHTGYGNAKGKYLPQSAFPYQYGTTGRGWDVQGGEMTPTGINTGGGQGHNHSITLSNTKTTDNPTDANGTAHNNMQPYKVVKRWMRVE